MLAIWNRIESWLEKNDNPLILNDGATDEEICQAEKVLGVRFPEDFRESLKIHNGQRSVDDDMGLIENSFLLSVQEIVQEWTVWKNLFNAAVFDGIHSESNGPIKTDLWWNTRWIPITHDGGGNHHCMDLDPATGGTRGQIITMWHDDSDRGYCSVSFRDWLEVLAQNFENGVYEVADNGFGGKGLFKNGEML